MTFEIAQILESKKAFRVQLASRPIAEKLRLLEELRRQAVIIAASRTKLRGIVNRIVIAANKSEGFLG